MRIETGSRHVLFLAVGLLSLLFVSLLIGVVGPQNFAAQDNYAYNCSDNNHHGQAPCAGGVEMMKGGVFSSYVDGIGPLYEYLGIRCYPFLRKGYGPNSTDITLDVSFYGANPPKMGWTLLWRREVTDTASCFQSGEACDSFYVLDDQQLAYPQYRVDIFVVGANNQSADSFLGDFLFQWEANNPAYVQESMAIRIIYGMVAFAVAIWYGIRLMQVGSNSWTMEQTFSFMLTGALVLINNPLYPLQVFSSAIIFPVVFSMFEAFFISLWLLYALLYLDMVRANEHKVYWSTFVPWLKVVSVFVFFALSVSLFMWQEVLLANNPIVKPQSLIGPSALFYVVALFFAALVCWIGILLALLLPHIHREGNMRYLHTAVPMAVVVAATLIGVFSGSIGPFGRTAPSFVFFYTLYNACIYFWIFGYWPVGEVRAPPNEHRPLVENPFSEVRERPVAEVVSESEV